MNMKRLLVLGILGLFLVSMIGGVLGADASDKSLKDVGINAGKGAGDFVSGIKEGSGEFFSAIGFDSGFTDDFLSKLFFAILLGMVIYTVVSSFFSGSGKFVQWGITGAITFIAFFGIPAGYLEALRTSYGAMGLTMLTVIPFLVMVVFSVKVRDLMIARGTWAFYAFYYFFFAISEIRKDGDPAYWIAFLGGAFMFLTIPYIRHWRNSAELETHVEAAENAINKHSANQKLRQESDDSVVGGLGI